jgi:ADP-ribosylglycohydrolase
MIKKISNYQLNRIKGVFYGQAIGDALGLGTEFLNKGEVAQYYPGGLTDYTQIIQDKHRIRWSIGDWTDDTDQFLCISNAIMRAKAVDEFIFAEELFKWFKGNPMGIGKTVYKVLSIPQFALFPHKAAEIYWKISKGKNASNGAIMRTSILGTFTFWDYDKVIQHTEKIARVTHWDNRCVGSSVIITLIIAHLIYESKVLGIDEINSIGEKYDSRINEYVALALNKQIESLNLDEPNSIGYTLKALSAGLWAYFNANSFEEGILKIIQEGGDADTNACIAGSVLGAKFGFTSIPNKYVSGLKNHNELEETFNRYIEILEDVYQKDI